ncbi:Mpo1-like protein [Dongia sedimenti]|uniref:DUF962 domain-containing protein n=1 Tax=Dongia sedimenti TaxID=3064282 RepID=A0ABU0YT91_9PROT|nr:DUF962 domain-containing protein [Rhodospirillaceae bacterium R-7]
MTFRAFWPLYLQAHNHPATRAVHYGATVIGVGSALATAISWQPLFLLGIGLAYGLAIGAHTVIERNQSMVRVNPVWGAMADLRMFWLALTGGLQAEIARYGRGDWDDQQEIPERGSRAFRLWQEQPIYRSERQSGGRAQPESRQERSDAQGGPGDRSRSIFTD